MQYYKETKMILKKNFMILFLATAIAMPLMAETQTPDDNEALKQEVQKLREEVKALNDIFPIRSDSTWGTGIMLGVNWGGMGTEISGGLQVGYSLNPSLLIIAELEEYVREDDLANGSHSPETISFGILARTPINGNLRGYFTGLIGKADVYGIKNPYITRFAFGMEFYTNKHFGMFMEIGRISPLADTKKYSEVCKGMALCGIRFYI
jgi:hypothetical protein